MRELIWKLRYALIFANRTGMSFRQSWDCAGAGWEANETFPCSPSEAVDEELSCWTE